MYIAKTIPLCLSLIIGFTSNSLAQIGNLGWAKGEEATVANEDKRLQVLVDVAAGTYEFEMADDPGYASFEDDLVMRLGPSVNYRFYRTSRTASVRLEASVLGSLSALLYWQTQSGAEVEDIGVIGSVAPQVAVSLFSNSAVVVKPFVSIGPGFYFPDVADISVGFVWVPRGGVEIHKKNSAVSLSIAIEYFSGEEESYNYWYWDSQREIKMTRKNLLGCVSVAMKM